MSKNKYSFEIYSELSSNFEYLLKEFELKVKHKNITNGLEWLKTWWSVFCRREDNQFGYNKQLYLIVFKDNKQVKAIIPLIKLYRKKYGIKVSFLEFLGQQWAATALDFIACSLTYSEIMLIFDYIYMNIKFDILNLAYIPECADVFSIYNRDMYLLSACPIIKLYKYNDFVDYKCHSYSKRLRQNIRTSFNKMHKHKLRYTADVMPVNTETFQQIKLLSKSKLLDGKHSIYLDSDKSRFFWEIAHVLPSDIVLLKIDSVSVAYRLNFYWMNIKFCMDASYDREYKAFDLGSLSVDESIARSFTMQLDTHCEGVGMDQYKLKFTKDIIKIYQLVKPGNTFFSKLFYLKYSDLLKKQEKHTLKAFIENI